jgi:hypothetical protein
VLRNKAALRNPDEFYFAMEKARTKDGVHLARCACVASCRACFDRPRLGLTRADAAAAPRLRASILRRSCG